MKIATGIILVFNFNLIIIYMNNTNEKIDVDDINGFKYYVGEMAASCTSDVVKEKFADQIKYYENIHAQLLNPPVDSILFKQQLEKNMDIAQKAFKDLRNKSLQKGGHHELLLLAALGLFPKKKTKKGKSRKPRKSRKPKKRTFKRTKKTGKR